MAAVRANDREHRAYLALAFLRVLMGVIFLAVWGDNLAKGLYSGSGWHTFVGHYAATTRIGMKPCSPPALLGTSTQYIGPQGVT